MLTLDHLALCCETLKSGCAVVEETLGVQLQSGGKHVQFGTHNKLLGLGPDLYFEVIARDPDAAPTARKTWFDLDNFKGRPRLGNWICSSDDYDADVAKAPPDIGAPLALERDDITWHLTVPEDGSLPFGGAYPSLIRWGDGVTPPPAKLPDQSVRLIEWIIRHPQADDIKDMVALVDPRVTWAKGPVGFEAVFDTPNGQRSLT